MTDPMLPVGQKMRRTSDGYETAVEASGEDWAIVRSRKGIAIHIWEAGARYAGGRNDLWVPVGEPATWDVRGPHGAETVIKVVPTGAPDRDYALNVYPEYLPDPSIADDLAHYIADTIQEWDFDHSYRHAAADHRAAQTEREVS